MFDIFKKKKIKPEDKEIRFEIELTASMLAYEIARSDGEISNEELSVLMDEVKEIAVKVGKDTEEIFNIIQIYSENSVSFYDFVQDINKDYTKEDKLNLLKFMWEVAYADGKLDIDEERLIRRVADLIRVKDMEVLKLKDAIKN
ncbi:MAG: TerB family tellurite resistance protein [Gammaproteobacteria bacterium]|tara:strand:- start:763 stop:1194 length:432 start_codon:yes stop_codon:yes gene_type:complete